MNININKNYIRYIFIASIILVLAIVGYFVKNGCMDYSVQKDGTIETKGNLEVLYDGKEVSNTKSKDTAVFTTADKKVQSLKVEIKGAVLKPGVYAVAAEDRVEDLVKLAGGFLNDADRVRIRLANRLIDEEVIYVYKNGEKLNDELLGIAINNHSSIGKANSGQGEKKDKININTATKEQLMTLSGIGEAKANSIIAYREEHNGFKSINELKNVSGIGEKTLSKFVQSVDIN